MVLIRAESRRSSLKVKSLENGQPARYEPDFRRVGNPRTNHFPTREQTRGRHDSGSVLRTRARKPRHSDTRSRVPNGMASGPPGGWLQVIEKPRLRTRPARPPPPATALKSLISAVCFCRSTAGGTRSCD